MRAHEFIIENVEHFNGLDFSIEIEKDDEYVDDDDTDNQTIYVKAFANGRELGHVLFTIDYDGQGMILKPQDLEVDERFQGQGIAAAMYDYVKSKGYKIRRSGQQTDAGAGFWGKHRPEQNVWEGVNRSGVDLEVTELPDEDQILITATSHGKTLGRVYFDIFDSQLVAADAEVASEYRGQGIAAIIYDYAKELGWEVVRSGRQTDAGAGFWDKHRPKQDVWEGADNGAVEELRAALVTKRDQLQSATDDEVYDIIDRIMTRIARNHGISGKKLHDMWVDTYKQVPDTWIMKENFADGQVKGQRTKGDR